MTSTSEPTIFISAGEASGDLHGAGVVQGLKRTLPGVTVFGLGGDRMQEEGVELLYHARRLAIMGFGEVIRHLPFLINVRRRVLAEILKRKPDLLILIDYPGMHFSLMRSLAKARDHYRPKILYYIAPQVWAWKASRAQELADLADAIAVIFPFEVDIFQKLGGNVRFVGHPLLDEVGEIPPRGEFLNRIGMAADDRVVGLFPGSRKQEIRRHLPILLDTARALHKFHPDLNFIVAESAQVPTALYDSLMGDAAGFIRVRGDSHGVMAHANASLVKSGSSTIEAAYFGNPFVVFYRTSPVSYAIGRRVVKVPHIAMANLLAGEEVVPEFVQHEANSENLAGAILPLLTVPARVHAAREGLKKVRQQLGEPGAGQRVAEMASVLLNESAVAR